MKKVVFTIYIILFTAIISEAQSLKGIIRDTGGEPVRYATVYVNELRHGTTANIKGEYDIKLKPGSYTVFFQSLGFSPEVRNVTIGQTDKNLDITLTIQYYQIWDARAEV